jgi:hypothetical protein
MRALALAVVLAGCAHDPIGTLRFKNQPPVRAVDDRDHVAKPPANRDYNRTLYQVDGFVVRRTTRALDLAAPRRAQDVNALDEVPDSTWFTNRIGVRELTLDELRRGPNVHEHPFLHRPWTITGAKVGGTAIGFVFEDARGDRYLLKFDKKEVPEMETGAHVIGQRIAWACGYNVPEDDVAFITRDDLVIAPDATKKNTVGDKSPLTAADLDAALAKVWHLPDGRIRVLVSRFVPGPPIGPYAREGIRPDDPNDLVPHELRRTVRGQVSIFAWLNHTDLQEDNTLDAYIKDPDDPERRYVQHYLIDFGKALGVMGYINHWQTVGFTYRLDLGQALRSFLTLGLVVPPWEAVTSPPIRGVGLFSATNYDPGEWRTNSPYWPFFDADRFDAFWGAKILIRFTREQLAAIVEGAQYSDPRAAAYMTDVLVERQRRTAKYWFDRVAPLDAFTVEPVGGDSVRVCFDDLLLRYGLADVAAGTRYHADVYDYDGRPTGWRATAPAVRGAPVAPRRSSAPPVVGTEAPASPSQGARVCFDGIVPPAARAGYTIVRLRVQRSGRTLPPALLHLARDDQGVPRVIGLRRE